MTKSKSLTTLIEESNPRDLKTLLELLLNNITNKSYNGLCHAVLSMWQLEHSISLEESIILKIFINSNRPKWYQRGYCFKQISDSYYWKTGDEKPRIKFLKHWIKKLK